MQCMSPVAIHISHFIYFIQHLQTVSTFFEVKNENNILD